MTVVELRCLTTRAVVTRISGSPASLQSFGLAPGVIGARPERNRDKMRPGGQPSRATVDDNVAYPVGQPARCHPRRPSSPRSPQLERAMTHPSSESAWLASDRSPAPTLALRPPCRPSGRSPSDRSSLRS